MNRIILITGASSGIGKACYEYLAAQGYTVFGTSRFANAGFHLDDAKRSGIIRMDVSSDESVLEAVDSLVRETGRIDVLVNNAGISVVGSVEDTSIKEARSVLETNFWGAVRVSKAVLPVMRKKGGGYVVNIGSMAGLFGLPFQAFYSASKFALAGMSEALRMEVKSYGVHVILVEPGDFRTGITANRKRAVLSGKGSSYSERFGRVLEVIERGEREGSDPSRVALLIERIINSSYPRPRYRIGKPRELLAVCLKNRIPDRVFEQLASGYWNLRE
jgi:NAD(P)-dependent dehydrogenase (short-subunit alcohol dehydrogenase family)